MYVKTQTYNDGRIQILLDYMQVANKIVDILNIMHSDCTNKYEVGHEMLDELHDELTDIWIEARNKAEKEANDI